MRILPAAALDQHAAILGKTGSGKTYAAKVIVEHLLHDGRQVCIIDPTSAWWGLRLRADGKSTAYDLPLIGGPHADIPLSERSGEAVARLVAEQESSVIIDTGQLTVGQYTRWFTEFAGSLYTLVRHPLHLVIDEAHQFMPQGKVPDPQAGKMLHAGNRLMSGGRSRGIRAMLITQRPAKLHKDSLSCADTLIAMRVIAPQDRGAIKDWIDGAGDPAQGRVVLDSLAQLRRGEGWVWYPEGNHLERVKFPAIKTYDSSATPTGDTKRPAPRTIDLSEITQAMEEAVKEAEANDPKLLRARIAELEAAAEDAKGVAQAEECERCADLVLRLSESQQAAADAAETIRRQREAFDRIRVIAQEQISEKHTGSEQGASCHGVMPPSDSAGRQTDGSIRSSVDPDDSIQRRAPAVEPSRRVPRGGSTPRGHSSLKGTLNGSQQRILDAIAWFESIRVKAPTRNQVGLLARIKPTGGHFGNTVGPLSTGGYIEYPSDGTIALTDRGRALAKRPARPLTLRDYHGALLSLPFKGSKTREMLAVIIRHGGRLTIESLGKTVGIDHTGGHFGNTIGPLGTLGLIKRRGSEIRPTTLLFPEGLR